MSLSAEFAAGNPASVGAARYNRREEGCARASDPTLRILMVAARYLPEMGGIETHVHEVSKRLVALGHSVAILTTDRSGRLPAEEISSGVTVRRVNAWPRGRDYYLAPGIVREIMRSDWDLVHVQGCHTFVPPLAMLTARTRGVPYVITFHSGGHSSRLRNGVRHLQWKVISPLVRRAARCIGVSRFEADYFSNVMRVPRTQFEVIPNGAQMAVLDQAVVPSVNPLVISIGRLERYKGHHRAIEAFREVLLTRPNARLRILGDGPYEPELRALVKKFNLGGQVEIGGVPPGERQKLATLLASAALVVLLSDYEAHPVAVAEALALGRPVLATDCSGFKEMAEQGLIRTVPLGASPSRIAEAMCEEINGRPARPSLELPTWDSCTNRLLDIYRSVTDKVR